MDAIRLHTAEVEAQLANMSPEHRSNVDREQMKRLRELLADWRERGNTMYDHGFSVEEEIRAACAELRELYAPYADAVEAERSAQYAAVRRDFDIMNLESFPSADFRPSAEALKLREAYDARLREIAATF